MRRWINVLVGLLVLVLVGGLVLAAVPRVRHAAVRMQCSNNLKSLGLAVINCGDCNNGTYPTATTPVEAGPYKPGTIPDMGLAPEKRLSWIVALVPYVDQVRLVIDRKKPWDAEENLEPRFRYRVDDNGTTVEEPVGEWKLLRCPSNPATASPHAPGLTHHVGVAGVGPDAASRAEGEAGIGFFGYERRIRPADITDGTATTMMVIETTWKNGPWTAGGYPTVRGVDPAGGPYLGSDGQFGSNHWRGDLFAFSPPYGSNVAFADGSVRCLTASIKPDVFEALATIAGGEDVGRAVDW